MSVSDESAVKPSKVRPVEFLEPGVSIIKPERRYKTLISVLGRVTLATLLLGAGVGAVFYSVVNSEEIARDEHEHTLQKPHKELFKFTHDQSCRTGVLTIERNGNETIGEEPIKIVSKLNVSWIQDNTHRRIVHRVGLDEADWLYTVFVYESYSVFTTKEVCIRHPNITYETFLSGFGLNVLPKIRKEKLVLEGKKPATVVLYQGEPSENATGYRDIENCPNPFLVTAFTQPNQGMVFGWQAYFQPTSTSKVVWMEYWFPEMNEELPDAEVFFDYPEHCLASSADDVHSAI